MTDASLAENDVPRFSVLIVAGGSGTRMGGTIPKQYQNIGNISVIKQCIKVFFSSKNLNQVRIVCDPLHSDWVQDLVHDYTLPEPSLCGNTRKDSVFNGLSDFYYLSDNDILLIHDAARPFVTAAEIHAVAVAAARDGAASLAQPVADTLRRGDGEVVDRTGVWAMQTPQAFRVGVLRRAHRTFRNDDRFTDDAGMVTALGLPVTFVPGSRRNFKITTPDDMEFARMLADRNNAPLPDIRTGFGFDVHAFDPAKPGPVILGGVAIPHPVGLAGHSDADVGLHALTDALLSTLAAGDIGTHFPPSDPQWKGVDSHIFLKFASDMVHEKSGIITLIDITFLCEDPKIGPHREAIQGVISRVTGVSPDRISIKATTTEKLGFTGRGEGIAAQATASVVFPDSV